MVLRALARAVGRSARALGVIYCTVRLDRVSVTT